MAKGRSLGPANGRSSTSASGLTPSTSGLLAVRCHLGQTVQSLTRRPLLPVNLLTTPGRVSDGYGPASSLTQCRRPPYSPVATGSACRRRFINFPLLASEALAGLIEGGLAGGSEGEDGEHEVVRGF
jgi:hypothetical protein